MSSSEADWTALREICARIDKRCADNETTDIPDDVVTTLLTSATTLYRSATHEGKRQLPAFTETASIPATSVVVTVSAMLRGVGMNPFDLSMWFNRPLPVDGPEG